MRSLCLYGVLTLLVCFGRGEASAQDTAAEVQLFDKTNVANGCRGPGFFTSR